MLTFNFFIRSFFFLCFLDFRSAEKIIFINFNPEMLHLHGKRGFEFTVKWLYDATAWRTLRCMQLGSNLLQEYDSEAMRCTNQQPPQRGGAVPGPVWVGSKWLLAFPRVPVTPGTPHSFFRYAAP